MELQTRRLGGLKLINISPSQWQFLSANNKGEFIFGTYIATANHHQVKIIKPRYRIGETVYIKEAFEIIDDYGDTATIHFPSTREQLLLSGLGITHKHWLTDRYGKMISPLFMPEWAARYFIVITDVRAERLQEINYWDAGKEGLDDVLPEWMRLAEFHKLWNSINKEKWESNPWVEVDTFRKQEMPGT